MILTCKGLPIKYHNVTYITAALQGFQKLIYVGVINVFNIYHEDRPHALMMLMIGTRSLNCKTSILKCHRFNVRQLNNYKRCQIYSVHSNKLAHFVIFNEIINCANKTHDQKNSILHYLNVYFAS